MDLDYRLWVSVCDCGLWRTVYISGFKVELVNSFRSLGITIIENISWSSHITTRVKESIEKALVWAAELRFFLFSFDCEGIITAGDLYYKNI